MLHMIMQTLCNVEALQNRSKFACKHGGFGFCRASHICIYSYVTGMPVHSYQAAFFSMYA